MPHLRGFSFSRLAAATALYLISAGAPLNAEVQDDKTFEEKLAAADVLAEKVAGAPYQKKPSAVTGRTSHVSGREMKLVSSIHRVKSSTGSLKGSDTGVKAGAGALDASLSRLGAEVSALEVKIRIPGSILFAFDEAELRPDALETLQDLKSIITAYKNRPVRVEGHTCSMGTDEYNQKLSERRAKAVFDWLKANGVPAARLKMQGFGESQPYADNSKESGRAQNRRVEVVISKAG